MKDKKLFEAAIYVRYDGYGEFIKRHKYSLEDSYVCSDGVEPMGVIVLVSEAGCQVVRYDEAFKKIGAAIVLKAIQNRHFIVSRQNGGEIREWDKWDNGHEKRNFKHTDVYWICPTLKDAQRKLQLLKSCSFPKR